jgi:choice-of-anchor B domain-containing protein
MAERHASRKPIAILMVVAATLAVVLAFQPLVSAARGPQQGQEAALTAKKHQLFQDQIGRPTRTEPLSAVPCVDGFAGRYPCKSIDLMAFVPIGQIGGGSASDIWGWTDQLTGKEYALFTRSSGVSFLDISDPENPLYLGNLPTNAASTSWRDVEVYRNHAFIVCDLCGNHGMQVFDLTRLRDVPNPPVTFTEDALYEGVDTVHTIYINTRSGYAYLAGSNTCAGGPHVVDIRDPLNPVQAGCYAGDGYTHEEQCVNYQGPDVEHRGKEICFASNTDTLTILDVTDKSHITMISRTPYAGASYTHQGWLTKNQKLFVVDDELDEVFNGNNTRTRFFNISDLEAPFVSFIYTGPTKAIDHNQYIRGPLIYQSTYQAGLRILHPPSTEVAYFDMWPQGNVASFNANWGNYPFFRSGIVIASHIEDGLFILRPTISLKDYSKAWMR